jgi:hypothetical protein
MMDNEELLREGECPESNCIEELGHAGPHSGELSLCVRCGIRPRQARPHPWSRSKSSQCDMCADEHLLDMEGEEAS